MIFIKFGLLWGYFIKIEKINDFMKKCKLSYGIAFAALGGRGEA